MDQTVYKKIALMGGAYGNILALKACYHDAVQQACDGFFFLGDAIGFAGHSDETLDFIFSNFDVFIAGNLESQAAGGYNSCACGYGAAEDEITGCRSFEWSLKSLGEANRQKLALLPEQTVVTTPLGNILLCHGSPAIQNEFLYESELDEQRLLQWITENKVQGFVCTHTGLPWIKEIEGGKFAMNCGVTGKPDHDGDKAVHYGIVDGTGIYQLSIRRVLYDYEQEAQLLRKEGVEEIFITSLETGVWTCGVKSLPEAEQKRISNI